MKCQCKDKIFHARELLGSGKMITHSKSLYQEQNPNANPIFNSYLLAQNEEGELEKIWNGDIESTSATDLGKLKILARTIKSNLYLYREATVHNATFNGRRFPYESPALIISKNGEITNGSDL